MNVIDGIDNPTDDTTLLKFRHLLERHQLGEQLFAEADRVLQERGSSGTLA